MLIATFPKLKSKNMIKKLLTIAIILSTFYIAKSATFNILATTNTVIQATSYYQSFNQQTIQILPGNSLQVYNTMYVNASAGDIITIDATVFSNGIYTRNPIQFRGIIGSSILPILFKNKEGKNISITQLNSSSSYGLNFQYCENIKVSGFENGASYMLSIKNFTNTASYGISFDKNTKNVELEHVEISNIGSQAVNFRSTEPYNGFKNVTDTAYFRQYVNAASMGKGFFHHNYIHNIGNKGFYIGSTVYDLGAGIPITINQSFAASLPNNGIVFYENNTWKFLPQFADTILVYNNIIDTIGTDGIQVAMAKFYQVKNNQIKNWGGKKTYGQMFGISIGSPSIGETFNNTLNTGNGSAIQCIGVKNKIFNNLIISPNLDCKEPNWWNINAIYLNDKVCNLQALNRLGLTYSQTLFEVFHNTIILNKNDSGRAAFFVQNFLNLTNAKCYNNLAVQDKNPDSLNTQNYTLSHAIFDANPLQTNFSSTNNFSGTDIQTVGFVDAANGNYDLIANCIACRNANELTQNQNDPIFYDLNNNSRKVDAKTTTNITNPSFGCYETELFAGIVIPPTAEVVLFSSSYHNIYNNQTTVIPPGTSLVVYNYLYVNATAGDTLLIDATNFSNGVYTRPPLTIKNFTGTSDLPIVFKNKNGKIVQITALNNNSSVGLNIQYCNNIKVSGLENGISYMLRVKNFTHVSSKGIVFDKCTKNVELAHVEVANTISQAVQFKSSEPYNGSKVIVDTTYCREYVNTQNLGTNSFHHNYIHNVGSEGFYLGSTSYDVGDGLAITIDQNFAASLPPNQNVYYANGSWRFLPHLIENVLVYNNIVDSTGWDGIQVASAKSFKIYNNTIKNWGYSSIYAQMFGIIIGAPSSGDVYNNVINTGNGSGIQCFGINNRFFNNLIINPNLNSKEATWWANNAVYFNDKSCTPQVLNRLGLTYSQTLFEAIHNTVILHKSDSGRAIFFLRNFPTLTTGKCYNNLAVRDPKPDTLNVPSVTIANPLFIANAQQTDFSIANNFTSTDLQTVGFIDAANGNFDLVPNCAPCRNAMALNQSANDLVNSDLNNDSRKIDATTNFSISNPSFGCYETQNMNYFLKPISKTNDATLLTYPNPLLGNEISGLTIEIDHTNNKITNENLKLEMVDLMGKLVVFDLIKIDNSNQYKLDTSLINYLSAGVYFGKIIDSNKSVKTLKLLVK